MVKATVVRGTFTERGKDGKEDRIVKPDDKDPTVDVTAEQLESFRGVLVESSSAAAERVKVKAETQRVTVAEVEAAEEASASDDGGKSSRRR
jgi:hypothetical protein